jgi:ATP-dependent Lon protease
MDEKKLIEQAIKEDMDLEKIYPLVALRGKVLFPKTLLNFDVGRPASVAAVNRAAMDGSEIFIAPQRSAFIDNPIDIQILNTQSRQTIMGTAIAKGILRTLGIPFVKPTKLYRVQVGAYELESNALITKHLLESYGFRALIVESQ